jgi:hypothetical protein
MNVKPLSTKEKEIIEKKANEFALTCELEELEYDLTQLDYNDEKKKVILERISVIQSTLNPNHKSRGTKEKLS